MIKQKSDRDQRTEPTKVVFRSLVLKAPRYITAQGHFTPILFYLSYGQCGQGRNFVREDLLQDDFLSRNVCTLGSNSKKDQKWTKSPHAKNSKVDQNTGS